MKTEEKVMMPRTLSFAGGFTMVQDAFEPHSWHGVSPSGVKSWTEHFQNLVDAGQVGK